MQARRDRTDDTHDEEVRLFSTDSRVMAIDSPIKNRILELVAHGPVPFDKIVEATGKAKSTISVHIRDLELAGLIVSRPGARDSRKRYIELSSESIGRLTTEDRGAVVPDHIRKRQDHGQPFADDDIVSFFRYVVQVFRTQAMEMGINLDPVLRRTGIEIGRTLAPKVAGGSVEEVVRKMNAFWQAHELGTITLVSTSPVTLEVDGCFECEDLPVTGHGACAFDTGVLIGIFSYHFSKTVNVVEEQCYSSGYDHCTFVITPVPEKP
ncbi:MAG: ArsR family transcriptional regulator [Methanomicrobiales archaeon]|nr:ArsR family transcriptional regulator [Methanomicrobiales archaeon]